MKAIIGQKKQRQTLSVSEQLKRARAQNKFLRDELKGVPAALPLAESLRAIPAGTYSEATNALITHLIIRLELIEVPA